MGAAKMDAHYRPPESIIAAKGRRATRMKGSCNRSERNAYILRST